MGIGAEGQWQPTGGTEFVADVLDYYADETRSVEHMCLSRQTQADLLYETGSGKYRLPRGVYSERKEPIYASKPEDTSIGKSATEASQDDIQVGPVSWERKEGDHWR